MMSPTYEGWLRVVRQDWVVGRDRHSVAVERIYGAATDLVLRHGLDAFDIDSLAEQVHCSRATIYRYAGGKAQIRDAVVIRIASGVIDSVRNAVSDLAGPERVVTAISVALQQIRREPIRRLLARSEGGFSLSELHASPVLAHLAAELAGLSYNDIDAARWIVRVVVSLAYHPLEDSHAEEAALRRFVYPVFS